MTSSLVGSEMCIRDSLYQCRFCPYQCEGRRQCFECQCSCGGGGSLNRTCLLYTSDAADDM
eukprot:4745563-Prorocentrum_lima.AAC.1